MGGGGKSGGGGSSSGRIKYPTHLFANKMSEVSKGFLRRWLSDGTTVGSSWDGTPGSTGSGYNISDDIDAANASNPFEGAVEYDPTSEIIDMQSIYSDFDKAVNMIVSSLNDRAVLDNGSDILSYITIADMTSEISSVIDTEDAAARARIERFSTGIASILTGAYDQATTSYAHTVDLSTDYAKKVVSSERSGVYTKLLNKAVSSFSKVLTSMYDAHKSIFKARMMSRKLGLIIYREVVDRNLMIDEDSALWDLGLWQYGASIAASLQGGSSPVREEDTVIGKGSVLRGELEGGGF